ncbi:MAG: peptidoglycan DD-metalloendopeptidase family protein [Candidatus Palauibacterales bacterium]|jgi:YD repeat-containing protein|nr:peptidoglycan DD-metalloendopeptidase family protein [Candidatus Palauibacterales bacterium]MDP2483380.1 peptidoglycan DD-metalloendopeptidase family protein [Candidatus Palauibacterales bacterium]
MLRSRTGPEEEQIRTVFVPAPPPPESVYDTLRNGETLAEVLGGHGFSPSDIYQLIEVVREYKSPRRFRPGVVMRLTGPPGGQAEEILLQLNEDSLLRLDASPAGWASEVTTVPLSVDTLLLAGLIQSSLWYADLSGQVERLGEGEFQEYVYDLADVFAWKVDFTRDIRSGDAFRVAIEREVRPDGTVRSRRFIAIELRNRGRVFTAIPYTRPGGRRDYFDVEGEALRGVFLRYPVPYRITSGFTNRRYHPVLKRYRAHRGIDYGAPQGTPVKATASGTVTRAGTWGDYGRMVEIRHTHGIQTRYAHLSAISAGIRVGVRVDQGQVIGRVGSTGLATGPHLHYEFLQNGAHRNPSSMNLPSAPALEEQYMEEFAVGRDAALDLLEGVALPATEPDAVGPAVAD